MVEEHTEETLEHEEVYVVVSGSAHFTVDGDEHDVGAGGFVYVRDPKTTRAAVALEDGTAVLAIGGKPGVAHVPSAWESWFAASPYRARGDYGAGLAIVREGLSEAPDDPERRFQVACYEALAGNRDEALAQLRFAVERDDKLREWAQDHPALESLRDDPEFSAIAGEPKTARGGA